MAHRHCASFQRTVAQLTASLLLHKSFMRLGKTLLIVGWHQFDGFFTLFSTIFFVS